jgi:hypothetical protein
MLRALAEDLGVSGSAFEAASPLKLLLVVRLGLGVGQLPFIVYMPLP